MVPPLFHATSKMPPPPSYCLTRCPFFTSHITHSLSLEPVARKRPSGEKATEYTGWVWCSRVWRQFPDSGSHRRTVESKEALQIGRTSKSQPQQQVLKHASLETVKVAQNSTSCNRTSCRWDSRGQHKWCIWVAGAPASGAPPQCVHIPNVVCKVVEGGVLLRGPDLGRAVV